MLLDVPRMNFLMIDGQGDPHTSQEFQEARDAWCWTLMIMQPDHITKEVVERATGPQRIFNFQLSIVNTFTHQANDSPFPLPYIPAVPSPSG